MYVHRRITCYRILSGYTEDHPMTLPPRLIPLLEQFDFTVERLMHRMVGPELNSGDGKMVQVPPMTDEEYLWEPVPHCWTIRPRADGPGPGATELAGAGVGDAIGPIRTRTRPRSPRSPGGSATLARY